MTDGERDDLVATMTRGDVFSNADTFLMDDAPISIAANVRLGPSVKLMTVLHPIDDHARRREGWERALPDHVVAAGSPAVVIRETPAET